MTSSIPTAVNNLLVMLDPAQGGTLPMGSQLVIRKYLPKYIAPITLQITGIKGTQEPAELGPNYKREEVYDIMCCLTSWAGDDDHLARFDQVWTNFGTIETTIGNNPWLSITPPYSARNGPVRFAQVIELDYIPDTDTKGFVVGTLDFTVHCEARVSSLT